MAAYRALLTVSFAVVCYLLCAHALYYENSSAQRNSLTVTHYVIRVPVVNVFKPTADLPGFQGRQTATSVNRTLLVNGPISL